MHYFSAILFEVVLVVIDGQQYWWASGLINSLAARVLLRYK